MYGSEWVSSREGASHHTLTTTSDTRTLQLNRQALGNFGLSDQRLGLQWAQRNLHAFGGDAHRVTLFGQSAGGYSVCQHLVSPASDRLFSGAIMQSGGCGEPWLVQDGAEAAAFGDRYATALGCPPTNGSDSANASGGSGGSGGGPSNPSPGGAPGGGGGVKTSHLKAARTGGASRW